MGQGTGEGGSIRDIRDEESLTTSFTGSYAIHNQDRYDEPRYDSPDQDNAFIFPHVSVLAVIDEYVAEPGTVDQLSYTASPLPGNLSTNGDITVLIDTYRRDTSEGPDESLDAARIGNFYTNHGDVRVIVNDWPDDQLFEDVADRLREQANFYSRAGDVTVISGGDETMSTTSTSEEKLQLLELGSYRERDAFAREELIDYWELKTGSSDDGDADRYAEGAKRWFESDTIPLLHETGLVEIGDTSLDRLSINIYEQELDIDDWYAHLEETDMVPYKAVFNAFQRSFYSRNVHSVTPDFVESGLQAVEEQAAAGPEAFMDETRFDGDSSWQGYVPDLLRRCLETGDTTVSLQNGELAFSVEAEYALDMGVLGLLPYRDELAAHGAELPDVLGDPAQRHSTIENVDDLSPDVRNRLEQLDTHDLIQFTPDENGDASLHTTNYHGGDVLELELSAKWGVDTVTVSPAKEDAFYESLLHSFDDLIHSLDDHFPDIRKDRRDLVRLHLYTMLEDVLDASTGPETGLVADISTSIHENMVSDTLLDQGIRGSGDMYVAIDEYVDRS